MVDPWGGLVAGLLTQVLGDLAGDLLESLTGEQRGAGVVDRRVAVEPRLPRALRARELGPGELDRLVGGVSDRLAGARAAGDGVLPDNEWAAAVAAVRDTLARSLPVDAALVVRDARLDPDRLESLVRSAAPDLPAVALLSAQAQAAYDRMLRLACAQVVEFITSRPEFPVWAQRELVRRTGDLLDGVDRLPERIVGEVVGRVGPRLAGDVVRTEREARRVVAEEADAAFTLRYAGFVVSRLDEVELVGVTLRQTPRRYALDVAYTGLSAARVDAQGSDSDSGTGALTGSGVPVAEALIASRRAVLRGVAGSGKTTTVQRLAVDAARRLLSPGSPAPALVPFVIPLRRFVSRDLPTPQAFLQEVAGPLVDAAPPGWVDRVLTAGHALVLVDGVDEVPSRAAEDPRLGRLTLRDQVEDWLADLVAAYPDIRVVVTSRLSAIPEGWLRRPGFDTFDLLPMGPSSIRDLIQRWHDAVAHDVPPWRAPTLQRYRDWLPDVVTSRPELHRLAASPLLCALICALNWDRQMELPTDRAGIYEAALDMLLDRRDLQRGVTVPEGVELAAREQSVLLQRLAYHLVKNELSELPDTVALAQLARVMSRIRGRDAALPDVLRHLITRTGLLRQDPGTGSVHFTHRTFQDYLAAREALEEGDIGLLVHRGHDDRWLDVIVMAAAQSRPRECGELLGGLLERGEREPGDRERLHLVAAAAMAQAVVVEPAEIRDRVERATADLIPPRSGERAHALARAGEFVLDLLPGPQGLDEQTAAYVVRTAALVGTEAARDLILRFAPAQPAPLIVDELLRAWRAAPAPEEYARTVLAPVRFGEAVVAVHRHRLPYLRLLPHLHAVKYLGDLVDLDAFARMPALHRLELFQNDVLADRHLDSLCGCPALRHLVLVRCGGVRDLSRLAPLGLTHLTLIFTDRLDVTTLAPLTTLADLTIRLRRLTDLTCLPDTLPLRTLAYGGRLPEATLAGIERFTDLERLEIVGTPSPDDLARLTRLTRLVAVTATATPDEEDGWIRTLQEARPGLRIDVASGGTVSQVA